jgi:hypothetical protein
MKPDSCRTIADIDCGKVLRPIGPYLPWKIPANIENCALKVMSSVDGKRESGRCMLRAIEINRRAPGGMPPARAVVPAGRPMMVLMAGMLWLLAATVPARATISPVMDTFAGSANGKTETDNLTVSASATFTINTSGAIVLTLANTTPETETTNELLTGIDFTLSYNGKAITSLGYTSATATTVTVGNKGKITPGTSTNIMSSWGESQNGYVYGLNFLTGKKYAIIGPPDSKTSPPSYDDATSSIWNGNSALNPFSSDSATFDLQVKGVTITNPALLTVTGVTFLFDTGCTYEVTGKQTGSNISPVPEHGAALVFGLGLALACLASQSGVARKLRLQWGAATCAN